jgi:hypothetical protein
MPVDLAGLGSIVSRDSPSHIPILLFSPSIKWMQSGNGKIVGVATPNIDPKTQQAKRCRWGFED